MKLLSSSHWRRLYHVIAFMLLPLQVFAGTSLPMWMIGSLASSTAHPYVPPHPPKVKVNRGPRKTTLIKPTVNLSANPTDVQIETARVFLDPLFPVGTSTDSQENTALASALNDYYNNRSVSVLTNYVTQHPQSRWNAALDLNLGVIHYQTGYLSLAISDWQASWDLLKAANSPQLHSLADRAFGELVNLDAELGRTDELKRLFAEVKGRGFIGSGSTLVHEARDGYQIMKTHTSIAFKCGPFALDSIRTADKNRHPRSAIVEGAMSTTKGTSLAMVQNWANKLGLNYQMAKRSPGASIIVPSVMHWKLGHFGALVREKNNKYLIQDPTFGGSELWVSADALEAETSGYFLVPAGTLPAGWTSVSKAEASKVWGKGGSKACNTNATHNPNKCPGMAVASYFSMLCSLHIQDTPVIYSTPVGPQVDLTVGYDYEEANQPANLPFANFGNDWVFQYMSYLTVDASQNVSIALRAGGTEIYNYSTFDNVNNVFAPDVDSQAQLYLTSPGTYERRLPDGSKDVYSQPDGTGRIFLTQMYDPQGNSLILNYDDNIRLNYVQDQIGQETTFSYLSNTVGAAGFYKIQTITDPFGRTANFEYDSASVQLTQITDAVGLVSQFTYDSNYFIDSMTTPYGKSLFYQYVPASDPTGLARGLRITFPDGSQSISENWLNHELNTYHWTRKQSPYYPDKTKAEVTHWLQEASSNVESDVIQYTKEPLEGPNPTWSSSAVPIPNGAVVYGYPNSYSVTPGTTDSDGNPIPTEDQVAHNYVGISNQPTSISRVLDDSTIQTSYYTTNSFGHLISSIDPLGRSFQYSYDGANNIDLLEMRQVKGSNNDLLAKYTYNSQHEPLTHMDGSGQTTTTTYNTQGQITTVTDPNGGVTTYNYDSNGYLLNVDGPLAGSNDKTSYTYDDYGRIYTVSDSEGYTLTFSYDNLDRITTVAYPDGTFEQISWNRLDRGFLRDRLGNWTQQQFDSLRQLVAVTDPDGRTTQYHWCTCGSLGSITDGAGHVTSWTRDIQGRATVKTYPDSSTETYGYETNTSRLKSVTDALSQVKHYAYNKDNTLSQVSYSSAVHSTSTVNYTYDSNYSRLTSVANGWGTVGYTYNNYITDPFGTPVTGAGRIQEITNSVLGSSANVTFTYDALRRMTNRSINGSANSTGTTFDAMGRVTGVSNPLGSFGYTYVDDFNTLGAGNDKGTTRLASMTYPNGQANNYSYYGSTGDERLQEIQNLNSSSAVISQFDYGYDAKGQITSWKQQADSDPATRYDTGYDPAGQLLSAVKKTDSTNAVLKQYYYNYDAAANRTSEQVDSNVTQTSVNNLNQITGQSAGGATRFQGIISKPGTVTVNGQSATMPTSTNFVANPTLTTGTNTVAVVATDGSGNVKTNNYQVVIPSISSVTPSYDAAGNMTDNGNGQTYQWDAENRLIQISSGGNTYAFAYDGLGRRVSETDNGTLVKQWIWIGSQMAEERDASNTVQKRFFAQGEQISGTTYFYTRDHLGSIREMMASDGTTIEARYDYDPYGRVTAITNIIPSDFQYAGYYEHAASGLNLTLYRAYDPNTAKWLSRDPYKDRDGNDAETVLGPNLYEYVRNNPIDRIDPLGLAGTDFDNTYFGSFSLFNLFNGNAEQYLLETLGLGGLKKGALMAAKKVCPNAAGAANELALPVGTLLTLLATAMDVPGTFAQGAAQNPNNVDPTMTPTQAAEAAGNGGMSDPYESLYGN